MKVHAVWFCIAAISFLVGTRVSKTEIRLVEKPVEVIRIKEVIVEKPVEVIKTVTVEKPVVQEVIVEKEKALTATEALQLRNGALMWNAALIKKRGDSLKGCNNFSVNVAFDERLKGLVEEAELKTQIELRLRRSGISVSGDAGMMLRFTVDGLAVDNGNTYALSTQLAVSTGAFSYRTGGGSLVAFMDPVSKIWADSYTLSVGSMKAREGIKTALENSLNNFENEYLEQNPKR